VIPEVTKIVERKRGKTRQRDHKRKAEKQNNQLETMHKTMVVLIAVPWEIELSGSALPQDSE
jgi:hypothetical protein